MKKLLAFILAFVILCSFAACGNEKGAATNDTPADEISSNSSSEAPKPAILNGTYFLYSTYNAYRAPEQIIINSQGISGDEQYGTMEVRHDSVNSDIHRYSAKKNELVMPESGRPTESDIYLIIDERTFMLKSACTKINISSTIPLVGSFIHDAYYVQSCTAVLEFREDGTCVYYQKRDNGSSNKIIDTFNVEQKENGLILGTSDRGISTAWYLCDGMLYWGRMYVK